MNKRINDYKMNNITNKYSLISLGEYFTDVVKDATQSIYYWRKYKHRTCYKCHKKGHIAKNCDEICSYCDNKHIKGLCPFLVDKIIGKLEGVLKFNKYTSHEELLQKAKGAAIKVQQMSLETKLRKIYKEKSENYSIEKASQLTIDASSHYNLMHHRYIKKTDAVQKTRYEGFLREMCEREIKEVEKRRSTINKASSLAIYAAARYYQVYENDFGDNLNGMIKAHKNSVFSTHFNEGQYIQKFRQEKIIENTRKEIKDLKMINKKIITIDTYYKGGLQMKKINNEINKSEAKLNKLNEMIYNKNEVKRKIINNAVRKAQKIFEKQKHKESRRQAMLDKKQEKVDKLYERLEIKNANLKYKETVINKQKAQLQESHQLQKEEREFIKNLNKEDYQKYKSYIAGRRNPNYTLMSTQQEREEYNKAKKYVDRYEALSKQFKK